MLNFLRNGQTVFQSSCTILHSYQQCVRVVISPHIHQHLLLSVFLITASLVCVKWYLTVVFICISLVANDVEHLFMCLLAICVFSFFNIYLFIYLFWLLRVLAVAHGVFIEACGIFRCGGSSLWHAGFSLVAACGFSLSSCGAWAPERVGSVVCSTWAQ